MGSAGTANSLVFVFAVTVVARLRRVVTGVEEGA